MVGLGLVKFFICSIIHLQYLAYWDLNFFKNYFKIHLQYLVFGGTCNFLSNSVSTCNIWCLRDLSFFQLIQYPLAIFDFQGTCICFKLFLTAISTCNKWCNCPTMLLHIAIQVAVSSANGHIMLNAPVLVRSLKLSSIEPC